MTCPRKMAVSQCGTRHPVWPPQDCFTASTTSLPCLHSLLALSQELFEWAEGLLSRSLKIYTLHRHQMKPIGALRCKHLFSCPVALHGAWSKISVVEHEAAENKVCVRGGGSHSASPSSISVESATSRPQRMSVCRDIIQRTPSSEE